MKIQATLTPKTSVSTEDFLPYVIDEEKIVWELYAEGTLREMYFQSEPVVVNLTFEAKDKNVVTETLKRLPMVEAQLFDIQLNHLGPWLPLAALFAAESKH